MQGPAPQKPDCGPVQQPRDQEIMQKRWSCPAREVFRSALGAKQVELERAAPAEIKSQLFEKMKHPGQPPPLPLNQRRSDFQGFR